MTGVDLSKILVGNQNIGGRQKGVKVINAWAFLNYWGHVPGLRPKVYAYASLVYTHVPATRHLVHLLEKINVVGVF